MTSQPMHQPLAFLWLFVDLLFVVVWKHVMVLLEVFSGPSGLAQKIVWIFLSMTCCFLEDHTQSFDQSTLVQNTIFLCDGLISIYLNKLAAEKRPGDRERR